MSIISYPAFFFKFKQLYLKDPSKLLVASYHRRKRKRCFTEEEPRPGSLEIFPEGLHMVDLIVITFIYVDKLRDKRNIKGG